MATAALQWWHLAIRYLDCLAALRPPQATNHEQTNGRYVRTTERTRQRSRGLALRITAITAVTADHVVHGRYRPVTAATAGHAGRGRAFRTRGHGPCVTNQARTARVRVRTAPSGHDLSTAVTEVVTAAVAPPGSRRAGARRRSGRVRVGG